MKFFDVLKSVRGSTCTRGYLEFHLDWPHASLWPKLHDRKVVRFDAQNSSLLELARRNDVLNALCDTSPKMETVHKDNLDKSDTLYMF